MCRLRKSGQGQQIMNRRIFDKGKHQSIVDPYRADRQVGDKTAPNFSTQISPDADERKLSLSDNMPDVVLTLDKNGIILTVNQSVEAYGFTAKELLGTSFIDLIHPDDQHRIATGYFEGVATGKDHVRTKQFRIISQSNEVIWIESNSIVRFTPEGEFIVQEGVCRDISDNIQAQEALEEQVRARTAELVKANEKLQREIQERRETEHKLRERESDLVMEKANLQETNTALKVLLKRREVDKQEFEEQVMYNVKELILPYMDMLKSTATDERQEAYLSILETNLGDVTSAFTRSLSLEFYGLTTAEIKVASFIRQGKKTREIASLLGLSTRTIDASRQSIRQKLRIKNKKANLRTLLQSMQ